MKTGTISRLGQWVRGDCEVEGCREADVLVYLVEETDVLVCAEHMREWMRANPPETLCDNDPAHGRAWRDPKTRKNEFFCAQCHGRNGKVFTNRWANADPRATFVLGVREKVECAAAGYGTDCRGEVKWRNAFNKSLCNKHAGKQSVGPEHHQ
jgi:hypothetical protein